MNVPKILKEEFVYDGFLKIKECELEYPNNIIIKNSKLYKPDAVAILVWNEDNQSFIFTRQYRYPVADREENGMILEVVAGTMEENEAPEDTAKRELLEEVGYKSENFDIMKVIYTSPGYSSEKVYLFLCTVKNSDKINGAGGGLKNEGEYIESVEIDISKAYEMLESNEIDDSKTIIGLQQFREKHFMSMIDLLSEEKDQLYNKIKELETKLVLLQSQPKL